MKATLTIGQRGSLSYFIIISGRVKRKSQRVERKSRRFIKSSRSFSRKCRRYS